MREERPIPPNSLISLTLIEIKEGDEARRLFRDALRPTHQQVKASPGLVREHLHMTSLPRTYITVTVWDGQESMEAFRDTGSHAEAMKEVDQIATLVRTINYIGNTVPTREEALQKLIEKPQDESTK